MKIRYKSPDEIRKLRDSNLAVSEILDVLCAAVEPGMSTWELDILAREEIARRRLKSAFLGYYGYPCVVCTSINEVVVHGIPRKDAVISDGDIISIDFGTFLHGYCGDSARTIPVGKVDERWRKLIEVTQQSLELAIAQCYPGNRLGDIGHAVQQYVESHDYSIVRDFVGHGIGRAMHEDPPVPNYARPGTGKRLKSGLVIAIEPMVNAGAPDVEVLADKWTAVTCDGSRSAHFEHSIAITDKGPWVLSRASSEPGNPGQPIAF
ncbi:type I methionyl aminopeptidase [Haliangium ochraceum]|uniref:Methionine aminopeptidase n=1 Tax=Haliangium ochraceum (strain DSM 14365 / JCM 11303 / SMP-2) TaxID=502025 RepID=D0LIA4_HALO1|nr:type I methionyl aminopeptidase [Haliangium ochraceum]ACY16483.1 methionine aminopeptidase, type I [Haliangium ochraceum DSM 14365]